MSFSVVLDTNVLYGAVLRDTALRLAEAGLYRPLWSSHILDELQAVVGHVVGSTAVKRIVDEMALVFEDAMVEGYEQLIEAMESPDPDDRHVLAAAVAAGASAIATFDQSGFPEVVAERHNLLILHPDEFLLDLLDMAPATVVQVLREQSDSYTNPPRSVSEILGTLNRSGVSAFATQVLRHL